MPAGIQTRAESFLASPLRGSDAEQSQPQVALSLDLTRALFRLVLLATLTRWNSAATWRSRYGGRRREVRRKRKCYARDED
jgi:hypothetical protein